MPDKIKFGDVGSDYEPTASEDEYSEGEKELLNNVRQRNRRNEYDEDDDVQHQAVLGFDDDAEDDYDNAEYEDEEDEEPDFDEIRKFEHDSDIDDRGEEDDLPDRYAWGKKAGAYYGTGYKDRDYDTLTAQEEEMARMEEEEAMEMQKRLIKGMTDEDFALDDLLSDDDAKEAAAAAAAKDVDVLAEKSVKKRAPFSSEEVIVIKGDLSDLSESQRLELFRKESPEFDGLVKEGVAKLSECADVLEPVLELLKKHDKLSHPLGQLLVKRYELHMLYCSNISFYVLLKSQRVDIRKHPLVKRLLQLKRLVQEMEQKYEQTAKAQVEALLEAHAEGLEITFEDEMDGGALKSKKAHRLRVLDELERMDSGTEDDLVDAGEEEGSDAEQYSAKRRKLDDVEEEEEDVEEAEEQMEDEEEFDVDGKRKITYQMAKNKGLSVRKRKDQRNIRVKNKLKYRKAIIRRKGAVRTVRTESKRYSGESSIKPYVKRGIKLK
ncbi:AGAP002960-PA [Anopheles gambiae str. PEST]|uniref:AGAP002960-PA n=1 Tax=Anopheles gambiae TaxID=7165 RepID=Q7PGP9_ANOGA|nr:something about silencing protein 10 [Anopheles gambiae]EAA44850.4 AGAP002960-PA [Anopheles gambiae str. PEST]